MSASTAEHISVLYEDNHFIAINKRVGDLVQGDKTGDMALSEMLKGYLKDKFQKPGEVFLGVIHRLDRPVSGVVLFAKTSKGLAKANALFQNKATEKTYLAIVENAPPAQEGLLEQYLRRNESQNKSYVSEKPIPNSKFCALRYKYLQALDKYHLLEVNLYTGRHHQIRAQLAHLGCPIKGDLKYNSKRSNPDGGISLHSYRLAFEHPVRKAPIVILAPPPAGALWKACRLP